MISATALLAQKGANMDERFKATFIQRDMGVVTKVAADGAMVIGHGDTTRGQMATTHAEWSNALHIGVGLRRGGPLLCI